MNSGWVFNESNVIITEFDETIKYIRNNYYPNNNLDDDRLLEFAVSNDIVYWTYFDKYEEDIPYWVLEIIKKIK